MWWAAIVLFAISLLAMGASLLLLAWAAAAPQGGQPFWIASLPTLYLGVVTFLISVLIKPHRRRALWFAGLGGVFLILLLFDLSKGTPALRLWPVYVPLQSRER